MNRLLAPAVGALALLGFAACSPDSKDFKSEGEDFIEEEDGELANNLGYTFSDADCDKPANTETGTTYDCTAVDDEGDTWDFSVEITGDRELTVNGVYHAKLVRNFVVEGLQTSSAGTVDEACVDELLASYAEDDLKAAVTDYSMNETPSAGSEALLNEIGATAATNCVS